MAHKHPECFGNHGDTKNCPKCGQRPECIDKKIGWGLGTLLADLEGFEMMYGLATQGLDEEERDLVDELLEAGGYTASDATDHYMVGRVPKRINLLSEIDTERKMREFMRQVAREQPRVWQAYQLIIAGGEPEDVSCN